MTPVCTSSGTPISFAICTVCIVVIYCHFPHQVPDESCYDPDDANAVLRRGTYSNFLASDKILNSLDNPIGRGMLSVPQISTDLRAADYEFPGFTSETFVRLMNWGLLAKANAVHRPHVDRTGMCTWVLIEDGLKKWDIGFPPPDGKSLVAGDGVPFYYIREICCKFLRF